MPRQILQLILIGVGWMVATSGVGGAPKDRIQPYPENPFYWSFGGEPVLLIGGSDEDNLFNDPELFRANLRVYEQTGANYMRCTLSWRDPGNVPPFEQLPDGRFDLTRFHPEFWGRLKTFLEETAQRGIVVQIEVWATFDYYRELWDKNPFHPKNNVNYTDEETQLPREWPRHPAQGAQPFFQSVPDLNNDTVVLRYQEAFVARVAELALPHPTVLFCMDNETMAPVEWALYWSRFIQRAAEKRGLRAMVTEMWDPWDLRHPVQQQTLQHPDVFTYVEVSQNNWQEGQTHYDRLLWMRERVQEIGPRPMNNVKVYMRRGGGKPNDPAIGWGRWWQNLFAGCAATRFHRPPSGSGAGPLAQTAIRAARAFFAEFPPFDAEPAPERLTDREENEAYLLAKPNRFALYFPTGGSVRLRVDGGNQAEVRWFDLPAAAFLNPTSVPITQGTVSLQTPDTGQTWLGLVRVE